MKQTPTGVYIIGTLLLLAAIGGVYHAIRGYPIYFLISLVYALLGLGLIKLSPLARIGTLVVLPIVALVSIGTTLGVLMAKYDPEMMKEIVELGIEPATLNTKLVVSVARILAVIAGFVYLLKHQTRQHFAKAEPVGMRRRSE